jgi:hypothetical protein
MFHGYLARIATMWEFLDKNWLAVLAYFIFLPLLYTNLVAIVICNNYHRVISSNSSSLAAENAKLQPEYVVPKSRENGVLIDISAPLCISKALIIKNKKQKTKKQKNKKTNLCQ